MRVLIAGGVFRMSPKHLAEQQPTPEMVLADGLESRGIDVARVPLEDLRSVVAAAGFDIVHVHHLSKAATFASISRFKTPVVFTAHGTRLPTKFTHSVGLRCVIRRADAFVCLSEAERRMRQASTPGRRDLYQVIRNGIPFLLGPVERRTWRGHDPFRLLFVGQLVEVKRIHLILQLMQQDLRLRLRLVYHNSHLRNELVDLASELGVGERLEFVGQLSGVRLYDEYRRAHALVLPSLSEALPSVVSECLSTALPVIASDVGGIREQVGSAGQLFPARDGLVGLSDALIRLQCTYDAVAAAAVVRAGQIVDEYSVASMVDRHIQLYERCLNGKR